MLTVVAALIGILVGAIAAAALLLPYLAWVSFAAMLNRAIVELNGPF